jgi:two-component system, chemotaxis family, chemotaxis protein CheY
MATILVVDDSKTIRTSLRRPLELAGHEVIEAEDGRDGLAKLETAKVDMILSDINMPEMDGLTMCKHIKENAKYKHIPIVVVSTEASPEMKAEGKSAGVLAWMIKPPNPAKLVEAVAKVIEMKQAMTGEA